MSRPTMIVCVQAIAGALVTTSIVALGLGTMTGRITLGEALLIGLFVVWAATTVVNGVQRGR